MAEALAEKGSSIWVLTYGTRGDHEPVAALALGLRKKGHRVKVFGRDSLGWMFRDRGLDFEAVDIPTPLHPANTDGRAELGRLAEEAGFEGPGKEGAYMFDTFLMFHEYLHRLMMKGLADGKTMAEVGFGMMKLINSTTHLLVASSIDTSARLGDLRRDSVAFLAEQSGKTVDEYTPAARGRRAAFRISAQRVAEKYAMDPFVFLQHVQGALSGNLLQLMGLGQQEQRELYEEKCAEFYAWHDESANLESYWEDLLSRYPPLEMAMSMGSNLTEVSALATSNLALLPGNAFPDLVVCHGLLWSVGLHLQATRGIKWLPLFTARPPLTSGESVALYQGALLWEGTWHGVPTPFRDLGVISYLDMMKKTKSVVSCSRLMLKDASTSQQYMKEFCTGKLVLDEPSSDHSVEGQSLFGNAEEQTLLENFLADADDPPVYMGWGSMVHPSVKALAVVVVGTLRLIGRRGVVVAGFSGLQQALLDEAIRDEYADQPDQAAAAKERLLFLHSASHEFLFRRCACLVHHGGAGTCHAALRSGVPSVVTPVLMDQPSNADWIESLGCGVKAAWLATLEAHALAPVLEKVLGDAQMKARAEEVAKSMAEERGVPAAVDIIEACLREPAPELPKPLEQPRRPWRDGVYDVYVGDAKRPPPDSQIVVRGNDYFTADGSTKRGQMRSGKFVVEADEKDRSVQGTYDIELVSTALMTVLYGHVSGDGTRLSFAGGTSFRLQPSSLNEV